MDQTTISSFANFGATGLVIWWLTHVLVPKLHEMQQEALKSFREEMEKERLLHRADLDKILTHSQWLVETMQKAMLREVS